MIIGLSGMVLVPGSKKNNNNGNAVICTFKLH